MSSLSVLLNFAFFVHHVLADYGIKLFHFKLVWCGSLIFVCGVEVASASRRNHSDFFSHNRLPLNLFAICTKFC